MSDYDDDATSDDADANTRDDPDDGGDAHHSKDPNLHEAATAAAVPSSRQAEAPDAT